MQIIKKRDTSKPNNSTAVHPSEAVALGCHLIILSFHTREVCTLQGLPSQSRCKISNYSAPYKFRAIPPPPSWLYIIIILHQTATRSISKCRAVLLYIIIILHQTATANSHRSAAYGLYIIIILHQTATIGMPRQSALGLYIIIILHQTATPISRERPSRQLYIIIILHQTATP